MALPPVIALTMQTLSAWGSIAEELKDAAKPVVTVAVFFIARVVASSVTFIMLTKAAGWSRVLRGLRYLMLPESMMLMIEETVRFIPSFLGDALTLTSAREARTLSDSGTLSTWRSLGTVASELILRASARAQKVLMAIESRTLASSDDVAPRNAGRRNNVSCLDALLYSIAALLVVLEVITTTL